MTLVLISGGLDSAVLLAHEAERGLAHPLYVRVGLAWEGLELRMLGRLLASPPLVDRVAGLTEVAFDMRDVYPPTHWAIRGKPPAYDTPDEDVYLAGRNLTLLTKAGIVAASKRIGDLALGVLANNPFPDARPAFFDALERALSLGLDHRLAVRRPFDGFHKEDIIRMGRSLGVPLELTLSCMNPREGSTLPLHCGVCSKCRERRDAFAAAGVPDPTSYAAPSPR
jgi:7-cyano-7-deazaguanine synthase